MDTSSPLKIIMNTYLCAPRSVLSRARGGRPDRGWVRFGRRWSWAWRRGEGGFRGVMEGGGGERAPHGGAEVGDGEDGELGREAEAHRRRHHALRPRHPHPRQHVSGAARGRKGVAGRRGRGAEGRGKAGVVGGG